MGVEGRCSAGATTCALKVIVFDMDFGLRGSGLTVIHVLLIMFDATRALL
jgi:hypothetical protein